MAPAPGASATAPAVGRIRRALLIAGLAVLTLAPAAASDDVTGVVVDPNGRPVPGARVRVVTIEELSGGDRRLVGERSTVADTEGRFALPAADAAGARSFILAEADGLSLAWSLVGDTRGDAYVQLTRPATLSGVVTGPEGEPVAAAVYLLLQTPLEPFAWPNRPLPLDGLVTTTDANGRFAFEALPADARASVAVVASGFAAAKGGWPWRDTLMHAVPGGEPLRVELAREGRIVGRVVDAATQEPLAGLEVRAEPQEATRAWGRADPWTARTDAAGRFTLSRLPEGECIVRAAGEQDGQVRWIARPVALRVAQGQTTGDVVLAADRPAVVEVALDGPGRLTAEDALNLSLCRVGARGVLGHDWVYDRPDEDGIARFPLPAGEYTVAGLYSLLYPTRVTADDPGLLVLRPGERRRLRATVAPLTTLRGVVRRPNGAPAAGAYVRADAAAPFTVTDAEGAFAVSRVPGAEAVRLLVRHAEHGAVVVSVPGSASAVTIDLEPAVTIRGRVVTTDGRPVAGAQVEASLYEGDWPKGLFFLRGGPSDDNGYYQIQAVPPGQPCRLRPERAGYGLAWTEITIADGDGVVEAPPIALAPADLALDGQVMDAAGRPVGGAEVRLYGPTQPPSATFTSHYTSRDGSFRIEGLAPGRVSVSVRAPDGASADEDLRAEDGAVWVVVER